VRIQLKKQEKPELLEKTCSHRDSLHSLTIANLDYGTGFKQLHDSDWCWNPLYPEKASPSICSADQVTIHE